MFILCICCKPLCAQNHHWQNTLYPILDKLTTIKFIWIIRAVIINITHPGLWDAPSIITTKLILTTGLNSYAKKWTKHVHCTNRWYYSNKVLITQKLNVSTANKKYTDNQGSKLVVVWLSRTTKIIYRVTNLCRVVALRQPNLPRH